MISEYVWVCVLVPFTTQVPTNLGTKQSLSKPHIHPSRQASRLNVSSEEKSKIKEVSLVDCFLV